MNESDPTQLEDNLVDDPTPLESVLLPASGEGNPTEYRLRRVTRFVEMRTVRAEDTVVELERTRAPSADV